VYNLAAVVSGVGAVGFAKKRKPKGGGGELYCLPESEREKIVSYGHLGVYYINRYNNARMNLIYVYDR
jgi:hypothetical protein